MKKDTRKAIIDAFNQLMQYNSFEEITIPKILSKAEVSKATFYRYFKDKQDVLCSNYDLILSKSIEASHDLPELMYQLALEYARFGKRVGKAFLRYSGDNNYSDYVNQKSTEFLINLYRESYGADMPPDILFQCRILMSGISNSILLLSVDATQKEMRHRAELLVKMMPEKVACLTW